MENIESPCIGQCRISSDEDKVCIGCLRSLDEIRAWSEASNEVKHQIMTRINEQKTR